MKWWSWILFRTAVQPILWWHICFKDLDVKSKIAGEVSRRLLLTDLLRRVKHTVYIGKAALKISLSQIYGDLRPLSIILAKRKTQFTDKRSVPRVKWYGSDRLLLERLRQGGNSPSTRGTGIKVEDLPATMPKPNCVWHLGHCCNTVGHRQFEVPRGKGKWVELTEVRINEVKINSKALQGEKYCFELARTSNYQSSNNWGPTVWWWVLSVRNSRGLCQEWEINPIHGLLQAGSTRGSAQSACGLYLWNC